MATRRAQSKVSSKASKGKAEKKAARKSPETKVTIKYDVGFNNQFFIRGQGAGLSWEKGQLLQNKGSDEWVWESDASFQDCEFKVLINDQWYESGENHHVRKGESLQYTPSF